ncbi:hypothetical protein KKC60_01685, partial [Patescibacteria group bacterium]|nr:hypothetical protein [Patescibacteria group bacterium]
NNYYYDTTVDDEIESEELPAKIKFGNANATEKIAVTFPVAGDHQPVTIYRNSVPILDSGFGLRVVSERVAVEKLVEINKSGVIKVN